MAQLSRDELKKLSVQHEGPAVSFYFRTFEAGADTRKNPIRFKNHVQETERRLEREGWGERDVGEFLAPAYRYLDDYDFWQHQQQGLAMFIADGESHVYRLPMEVPELTIIGRRFHLKPLLPLLTGDGRFHILAASLNEVKLFEATRDSISEVELEDMPTSLEEALKFDDPEKSLQSHSTSSSAGQGRSDVMFHGTGAGDDDRKEDILRFFRQLDNGIFDLLNDDPTTPPLVFAGVDYLFPIYQEANHYNGLLAEAVEGSPERVQPAELHERAWNIVAPHFQEARAEAKSRYGQGLGTGNSSADLREILPASLDARIGTLFVALDRQQWGHFDVESRNVDLHEAEQTGDEDLLDFAAVYTLLNGGTVYAVPAEEVPGEGSLAAIFRF